MASRRIVGASASVIFHTHTHPFNGPFSGTTRVSRYQKGKTNLDFTEARDNEWQWHHLGHMQVCTSLQTDNHASTPPLRLDALPAAQPTASKHSVIFHCTIKSRRWQAVMKEVDKGCSKFFVTVGTLTRTVGILIHSLLKVLAVNLS